MSTDQTPTPITDEAQFTMFDSGANRNVGFVTANLARAFERRNAALVDALTQIEDTAIDAKHQLNAERLHGYIETIGRLAVAALAANEEMPT